ncbi:hypothetical protein CC2G_004351 [Coprinopsis cinerea AmutBmut pab1-1]|nr:hypothetical protein CC2G_004351 [Coprinopsis cinerea AmutBmut pab1-1]
MAVFSCLICLENFDIDTVAPVILACHHIFCFNCVRNLIQRDMACPFRCPGGPVTPPDVTPTNFSIISTSSADNKQVVSDAIDAARRCLGQVETIEQSQLSMQSFVDNRLSSQADSLGRQAISILNRIDRRRNALHDFRVQQHRLKQLLHLEATISRQTKYVRIRLRHRRQQLSTRISANSSPSNSPGTSPSSPSARAIEADSSRSTPGSPSQSHGHLPVPSFELPSPTLPASFIESATASIDDQVSVASVSSGTSGSSTAVGSTSGSKRSRSLSEDLEEGDSS